MGTNFATSCIMITEAKTEKLAPQHIKEIALLGIKIGAQKISLLPYHEGGRSKNAQLGRPDELAEVTAPSDGHIDALKGIVEDAGLQATIGN